MYELEALTPPVEMMTYMMNLAVAVSLLCGAGLFVAGVCRRGSAPLRHGVLGWTLGLILCSPAAVWLAQRNGLAIVQITVADASVAYKTATIPRTVPDSDAMPTLPRPSVDRSSLNRAMPESSARRDVVAPVTSVSADSAQKSRSTADQTFSAGENQPPRRAWWQILGGLAALCWAVGMVAALLRMVWGCLALARFCRGLERLLSAPEQRLLVHQAADAVGLRRLPPVFFSRAVSVPVSVGLFRPAVVLPHAMLHETDDRQLQAVLLHEIAHIARRDHWIGVGQRIAATLFWWNPLVHRVCEEISDLREEICDNYVVRVQGGGQRLAEVLVDLASLATMTPLLPSTIGVLEPQSAGLTGRVTRLLDKERTMETRMNLKAKLLVLSCSLAMLVGMATIGGLRLADAQPTTEAKSDVTEDASQEHDDALATADGASGAPAAKRSENANNNDARTDRFEFRGQVLDPKGEPLSDANIYIVFHQHARTPAKPPKVRATTGSDGTFHFAMTRSEFDELRASQRWNTIDDDVDYRNDCRVVAVAKGYGPDWQPAFVFDPSGEVRKLILQTHPADREILKNKFEPVLKLVDDVPLVGRLVDPAGKPVAGVRVAVTYVARTKSGDLTEWLRIAGSKDAEMRKLLATYSQSKASHGTFTNDVMPNNEFPQLMPTAVSDADGRVQLSGIGRERIADLSIESPEIATSMEVAARTRPGPTLTIRQSSQFAPRWVRTYLGSNFEYTVRPSTPIVGMVRDVDTGKPLQGITIQGYKVAGSDAPNFMASYYFKTTTDEQGHYRITGMPLGKDNAMLAVPPKDQPYLFSKKVANTAEGPKPLEVPFELKRGVWIRGRVTDAKTGEPIPTCVVDYYVYRNNPNLKSAPGFNGAYQHFSYRTDKDGRYALPGLPGFGVVAVRVLNQSADRYPLGVGAEKIPELRKGHASRNQFAPEQPDVEGKNAVAEVNVPEGSKGVTQDFQLDPGQVLTGTVFDPDGKPLTGAFYSGWIQYSHWNPMTSNTFTINCYRPDHPRQLLFLHLDRKLAGSRVVEGPQSEPIAVRLQPWGVLTGRIVDAQGNPMGGITLVGNNLPTYLWQHEPGGGIHDLDRHYVTDQDGRFRIEGLAPNVKYTLSGTNDSRTKYYGKLVSDATVNAGQMKDVGEIKISPPPTQQPNTWQLAITLDAPNLDPPVAQYALFDKDPLVGYYADVQRNQASYKKRLEQAGTPDKDIVRTSQMTVLWDLGFKAVNGADLHLLQGTSENGKMVTSNGSDGKKWVVTKTVRIDGKPVCWCVPVHVKKGRTTEVRLTEDNLLHLEATFDKAMQESDPTGN
ncbi:MAG: M56 family metallopeptidase [Thermoguttaceae bacterium]